MWATATHAKQGMEDCANGSRRSKNLEDFPSRRFQDEQGDDSSFEVLSDLESDQEIGYSSPRQRHEESEGSSALFHTSQSLISLKETVNVQQRVLSFASEMLGSAHTQRTRSWDSDDGKPASTEPSPRIRRSKTAPTQESTSYTKGNTSTPAQSSHETRKSFPTARKTSQPDLPPRRSSKTFETADQARSGPESSSETPVEHFRDREKSPMAEIRSGRQDQKPGGNQGNLSEAQTLISALERALTGRNTQAEAQEGDTATSSQPSAPLLRDLHVLITQVLEGKTSTNVEKVQESAPKLATHVDRSKVIKFKDAVGRKFTFPLDLCKTWQDFEALLNHAFSHVDILGDHVVQGHYDLVGPDGEIILPQVWESMIEPSWEISMQMWPVVEEDKKKKKKAKEDAHFAALMDPFSSLGLSGLGDLGIVDPTTKKASKGSKGEKKKATYPSSSIPPPPLFPFPPGLQDPLAPPSFLPVDEKKDKMRKKKK